MKYESELIFPVKVYNFQFDDYKEFNKKILTDISKIDKTKCDFSRSNKGGFHSKIDIHKKYKYFKKLSERIKFIFNDIIIKNDYPHMIEKCNPLQNIAAMWTMINKKGHYNSNHIHPDSWFSGVYYIKVPDDNAQYINLEDPVTVRVFSDEQPTTYRKQAIEGNLIIFPGWIYHNVPISKTNDKRIAISFNVTKPSILSENL